MMAATLSTGDVVRILFKHERFNPMLHLRKHRGDHVWITGQTTCRVVKGPREAEVEVVVGMARCSASDNFEKETARQTALRHALGVTPGYELGDVDHQPHLRLPPSDAGAILAAYYGRTKKQPKKSNEGG